MSSRSRRCRTSRALLISTMILCRVPVAGAEEAQRHLDVGLRFSFMPTGTFELSYSDDHIGSVRSAPAIKALGLGAFTDFPLDPYIAVGFGAEAILNVIPDVPHYEVGQLLGLTGRLKLTWPVSRRLHLHAALAPGYGIIFGLPLSSQGFTLTTTAGASWQLTSMNAAFVEVGYMAGFQRLIGHGGERYSPSYLVTSCGWQLSL